MTSNFPFNLRNGSFVNLIFPIDGDDRNIVFRAFRSFTGRHLLIRIVLFFFFRFFGVLLITFISGHENDLRATPSFFTRIFNCQTSNARFLVGLLRLIRDEGCIELFNRFFYDFTRTNLLFRIFLRIVFTRFVIRLRRIVRFFNMGLMDLPRFVCFHCQGLTCFVPFLLWLLGFIMCLINVFLQFNRRLRSFRSARFLNRVFFFFFFLYDYWNVSLLLSNIRSDFRLFFYQFYFQDRIFYLSPFISRDFPYHF